MRRQVPFTMGRHRIARLHQAVQPPQLIARRMAGDVHQMIDVGHQMHAAAHQIVLHRADRPLVAGDDTRREDHCIAFAQGNPRMGVHRNSSQLMHKIDLDKLKNESDSSHLTKCISLLKAMGSEAARKYLPSILPILKSRALQGHVDPSSAQDLAKLFPKETTVTLNLEDEMTGECQSIPVNFFILMAHSFFFRTYFSEQWVTEELSLKANPTLFNIIYQAISKKELRLANLDREDLAALKEMAEQFGFKLPILEHYSTDGNHRKSFYSQFLENSYSFPDQKELTVDYFLYDWQKDNFVTWRKDRRLIEYFLNNTPNIEVIKINSSSFREDRRSLKAIIERLPKLREVHIDLSMDSDIIGLESIEKFISTFIRLNKESKFYLKGKQIPSMLKFIMSIPGFVLKGLDLSGKEKLEEFNQRQILTPHLECLNLSNSGLDVSQFIELAKKTPQLKEIDLRHCPSLTDEALSVLTSCCPQLTSVNLFGNEQVSILRFVKSCPHLEVLRISSKSDQELEEIFRVSKDLSLYMDGRQVLHEKDILSLTPQLTERVVEQRDFYLLESSLNFLLKRVLDRLIKEGKGSKDSQQITKILDTIAAKKSDSLHPLLSCLNAIKQSEELKSFCLALAGCQNLCLDNYLPKDFVHQLHNRLMDSQPSLPEARKLSKLFASDKIEIHLKGSDSFFSHDPLVLQSIGSDCLNWLNKKKVTLFSNPMIFKTIHLYLTTGQVNLKRLNIHACSEICREINHYGLSLEEFLNAAEDGDIGLKLKAHTNSRVIEEFLSQSKIVRSITRIDITKADPHLPILNLVSQAKNLKAIRLTARPMPEQFWEALQEKGKKMEIILTLSNWEENQQFRLPLDAEEHQPRVRLEKMKGFKFPPLSEYLQFIERLPGLIELDFSEYQLKNDSPELAKIIALCQAKEISILKLGDCSNLDIKDFEDIAKNCLGLRTLICFYPYPYQVKQVFANQRHPVNCLVT